jgi:hypothetical protein
VSEALASRITDNRWQSEDGYARLCVGGVQVDRSGRSGRSGAVTQGRRVEGMRPSKPCMGVAILLFFICHLQFVIRVCALDGGRRRRSAHKRGGVAHGAGAARLADMAMDPDALEQSEGEKD